MPRVAQYNGPQVQARPAPDAYQRVDATAADFGAGIGQAMQGAGQRLDQLGNEFERTALKIKAQDDEAAAKAADVSFNTALRGILYDPEKGFYAKTGKLAVDGYADAMKQVEALQEIHGEALTKDQRRLYDSVAATRINATLDDMSRHVSRERRTWLDTASEARITDAISDGAANYSNPARINQSLIVARNEIMDQAERNGWDPSVTKLKLEKAQSDLHVQVISNRMVNDPIGAQQYFETVRDRIMGGQVDTLERGLKTSVAKATAQSIVANISNGGAVDVDSTWAAMKQAESAGKQFGKDGKPLTSSAGAVGVGQVMPATGPEAAQAAGLPWDEQRFKTDAAYNEALGKAYYQKMLAKYDGNRTLAIAAYNAGPGTVDGWLGSVGDPRKGGMTDAEWAAKLPYKETRDYVEKVQRRAQAVSADRPSLSAWLEQAKTIQDPDVRQQVESGLVTAFNRHEAQIREAEKRTRDEVWKMALDPSVSSPAQIPNDKWAMLPGETQRSIMTWFEHKAQGTPVPVTPENQAEYYRLAGMASQDPVAFADMDLGQYIKKLPQTQWQQLVNMQSAINRKDAAESEKAASVTKAMSLLRPEAEAAGLKLAGKRSENEKNTVAMFQGQLAEELGRFQDENKRRPKDDEVLAIGRKLLVAGRLPRDWWFDKGARQFEAQAAGRNDFYVTVSDIPKAELSKARAGFKEAVGRDPTDAEVVELYRRKTMGAK